MSIIKPGFTVIAATLLVLAAYWSQAVAAQQIESPVTMLERTSQQVIKILRDDEELLKKEPERVYKIVDDYISGLSEN